MSGHLGESPLKKAKQLRPDSEAEEMPSAGHESD